MLRSQLRALHVLKHVKPFNRVKQKGLTLCVNLTADCPERKLNTYTFDTYCLYKQSKHFFTSYEGEIDVLEYGKMAKRVLLSQRRLPSDICIWR